MASQNKVTANQRNAKASTGPKSRQGKAIASTNATRHGILSQELLLPHESPAEFDALLQSLIAELGARGTLECALVERIAVAIWRQRRLVRAERQDIQRQNEGGSLLDQHKDSSGRARPDESLPDAQLKDFILAEPRHADKLDALEREVRLMSTRVELTAAQYEKHFPMLAVLFPPSDELKSDPFESKRSKELNVLPAAELNKWLAGIVRARSFQAELEAGRDAAHAVSIPSNTESLARYQAALDNEWYKAMRAFREARQHRMRTLEDVETLAPTIGDSD
jgi:hypothetical protein